MRAVVQRVTSAAVSVAGEVVGSCGKGLVVLAAAHVRDTEREAAKMADRIWGLRVFNDDEGKMNVALRDLRPEDRAGVLAVSNFTIYGETSKNRRPSFAESAPYERGEALFGALVRSLRELGCPTQEGIFGAHMRVSLHNDGPVTVILDVPPGGGR